MTIKSIDKFISNFPTSTQEILQKVRNVIQLESPKAEEAMAYGIPTFKLNGKNLVHFAGYEKHIGFYPTPSGITAFKKELKGYKHAKGSVQFPLNRPIPYDLIKRMVEYRVKEVIH